MNSVFRSRPAQGCLILDMPSHKAPCGHPSAGKAQAQPGPDLDAPSKEGFPFHATFKSAPDAATLSGS